MDDIDFRRLKISIRSLDEPSSFGDNTELRAFRNEGAGDYMVVTDDRSLHTALGWVRKRNS
jgi:hypothetical protein